MGWAGRSSRRNTLQPGEALAFVRSLRKNGGRMEPGYIEVRGARTHNLQGIDVDLPRNRLIVVTGVSGSGKSSFAFDTVYAEGQRRYVESLSAYARQFLDQMQKPDVDSIEGLSPAISIEQKTTSNNPRSTVGTVTEIYDYLRLLYARVGQPACPNCARPVARQSVQQVVDQILDQPARTKVILLAPIVRDRKGEYRKELDALRKDGFTRVRVDGDPRDLSESITLNKKVRHSIDVIVDRLVVKAGMRRRLTDSVELALRLGDGLVSVQYPERDDEVLLSQKLACLQCGVSLPDIEPRTFSFNSPHGACGRCNGLGELSFFDEELVVPDPTLSLADGALAPWRSKAQWYTSILSGLCKHYGTSMKTPWKRLKKRFRDVVLYGSGEEPIKVTMKGEGRRYTYQRPFEGLIPSLERRMNETASENMREQLGEFTMLRPCPDCEGARLKPEARVVTVAGRAIHAITGLSVGEAKAFFDAIELAPRDAEVAERLLREIRERLGFLFRVGLQYLTLDRRAGTLSGGESQRIRLATQIGRSLVGVLYILDEPSIGLHQRDNARLLSTLTRLRDLGNTVVVVEHDEETIRAADWIVDLGPGAGVRGGQVVSIGPAEAIQADGDSLTGRYLAGDLRIEVPPQRRAPDRHVVVRHAAGNNLKGIDVAFPLGVFTCVTGVSGSGKSTLVNQTLHRALARVLHGAKAKAAPHAAIDGIDAVDKIIDIDQSPIGRTPRSNPATYTQLFSDIRDLFSSLPEAKIRGYKPGRFSFNVKGGRCETCEGDGLLRIEMHFLPDVFVTCETCSGRRYNRETLEVTYRDRSIADVLDMTVAEALAFFENVPALQRKLQTLSDVGLGYIRLGQQATTLSGGEAQRVKLAKELSRRSTGRTVYVLDEPTTGLHFHDVRQLLDVLHRLVDQGNTVVVIEHDLDVIKTADWVIDLGPEGGAGGGQVVAEGTPEMVAAVPASHTGTYLRQLVEAKARARRRRSGGKRRVAS